MLQASTKVSKTPLANLTRKTIPVLEEELGESVGFHNVGSLRIAATEDRAADLDAMAQDASTWGIPVEWPSAAEVNRLVPWLDTSTVSKAAFMPSDGWRCRAPTHGSARCFGGGTKGHGCY